MVLFILMANIISCSDEDNDFNHDLDNTVWVAKVHTEDDYINGLIFSDGYMQKVRIDRVSGSVIYWYFSVEYSLDRAGEQILLFHFKDTDHPETIKYSFKKGFIYDGTYEYFLR